MTKTKYCLLLLLLPLVGLADTPPATLMHRIDAGSFDARGWTAAESTDGNFAVLMPGPFSDFSVLGDPDGVAERMEGVGGKAPNGTVFTALKMVYKSKGTALSEFKKYKSGDGLPSANIREASVPGMQALDISYTDADQTASERVILAGEDLYTLTVEWPSAAAAPALLMAQPFIESFKVLPKSSPHVENPTIWQHDQFQDAFMRTLTKDICMKKTIATLSRSGCATKQCLASIAGVTGQCVSLASGSDPEFCTSYDTHYLSPNCAAGGLGTDRCGLLNAVKTAVCNPSAVK